MTSKAEWLALAERCEKATGPDRELAKDFARALGLAPGNVVAQGYGWREDDSGWWLATGEDARIYPKRIAPPPVLSSLDAITALIARELPEAMGNVQFGKSVFPASGGYVAQLIVGEPDYSAEGRTPALALCAAFCRAMAEKVTT
jgi:hypothetical protein